MAQLKVTQVRSVIGTKHKQRESVRSLGLKRIHHSVVVDDTPLVRGYINAAPHLLSVEELAAGADTAGGNRAGNKDDDR